MGNFDIITMFVIHSHIVIPCHTYNCCLLNELSMNLWWSLQWNSALYNLTVVHWHRYDYCLYLGWNPYHNSFWGDSRPTHEITAPKITKNCRDSIGKIRRSTVGCWDSLFPDMPPAVNSWTYDLWWCYFHWMPPCCVNLYISMSHWFHRTQISISERVQIHVWCSNFNIHELLKSLIEICITLPMTDPWCCYIW